MLDGYQTKTVIQPINAPWWDNYVTEFFTENLIPFSMRDEREYKFQLRRPYRHRRASCATEPRACVRKPRHLPKPRRGGILGWLGFCRPRDWLRGAIRSPFLWHRHAGSVIDRIFPLRTVSIVAETKLAWIKPIRLADLIMNEVPVPTSERGERP